MYGQVQSCCLLTKSGGAIYFSFGSIVGAWLCQQEALLLFSLSDVIPIFLCRHFYHVTSITTVSSLPKQLTPHNKQRRCVVLCRNRQPLLSTASKQAGRRRFSCGEKETWMVRAGSIRRLLIEFESMSLRIRSVGVGRGSNRHISNEVTVKAEQTLAN